MQIFECKNRDFESVNNRFTTCSKQGEPFVIVKHKRKYSTVEWDYISIPKEKDSMLFSNGEIISNRILSIFDQYSNPKSHYFFSAGIGSLDNLFTEDAKKAACLIYQVLKDAILDINLLPETN